MLKYKGEHLGALGVDQIAWLKQDLAGLSNSTPVVVFVHLPLWAVYPAWGWVTEDAQQAMALLTRFGSVTVLNGHIHQVLQKVEGNVTFHTAISTAFPQPAHGAGPGPGPMKILEEQARPLLGMREVRYVVGSTPLAVIDSTLTSVSPGVTEALFPGWLIVRGPLAESGLRSVEADKRQAALPPYSAPCSAAKRLRPT